MSVASRPPLLRPSLFALTWQACTWIGAAIIIAAAASVRLSWLTIMAEPLLMVVAIVVLSELRPIVMTRLVGNPVSISLAFVFATMYLWGLYPAVLLLTLSTGLSELLQRKPAWKIGFNLGQYTLSLTAAWLVMRAAGIDPTPLAPQVTFTAADLWWIVGSWAVYHLVNLGLVACLADEGVTWWEDFSDEFWFYTVSTVAVLALSPLIAIVALAYPYSWTLLPLLLLPLLAVQKAAQMSRDQEHQALHDPLTGLPNRLLLTDRIEQALVRSKRSGTQVVVMFLDLDLFKVVNDSLGHHAGDTLLTNVATRLHSVMKPGDTLARFGGDEFVAVCELEHGIAPTYVADAIVRAMRRPLLFGNHTVRVTASVGVAIAGASSDSHTLLRDADAAMYRAKEDGRDRVAVFHDVMREQAQVRLADSIGLQRALDLGELRLVYQPIVDLGSGVPTGLEALMRWEDPDRGLLSPDQFIAAAEETGLIVPMGLWALNTALADLRGWHEMHPDLWVAVNLSSRQLATPGVAEQFRAAVETARIPPDAVHFEITESTLMSDGEPVAQALIALRQMGFALAVDDFGTGYSSLAYLKRLPVTALKIDRSFVTGLGSPHDSSDRPIVEAIVGMADALELDVVAEGVETPEQRAVLEELGVRVGQGYLWSKPLLPEEVPGWLAAAVDRGDC